LGSLRNTLSSGEEIVLREEFQSGFRANTWSGVLANNVGSAALFDVGGFEYIWGETYKQYLLSLPPGPISRFIGYERPLETYQGPSWWFPGIGVGGMHPAVIPFHNFGVFGVFFILAIWGFFIRLVDAGYNISFWPRFWYACLITNSFGWFWYGDMYLIRGLMAGLIVGGIYQLWNSRLTGRVRSSVLQGNPRAAQRLT